MHDHVFVMHWLVCGGGLLAAAAPAAEKGIFKQKISNKTAWQHNWTGQVAQSFPALQGNTEQPKIIIILLHRAEEVI